MAVNKLRKISSVSWQPCWRAGAPNSKWVSSSCFSRIFVDKRAGSAANRFSHEPTLDPDPNWARKNFLGKCYHVSATATAASAYLCKCPRASLSWIFCIKHGVVVFLQLLDHILVFTLHPEVWPDQMSVINLQLMDVNQGCLSNFPEEKSDSTIRKRG